MTEHRSAEDECIFSDMWSDVPVEFSSAKYEYDVQHAGVSSMMGAWHELTEYVVGK